MKPSPKESCIKSDFLKNKKQTKKQKHKGQPLDWETIFANNVFDKRLIYKILHKELIKLNKIPSQPIKAKT